MRALGVDVGGPNKGLDVVALDEDLTIVEHRAHVPVYGLSAMLGELVPDVIAIDSPPALALSGSSRKAERDLGSIGIHSYATPSERERLDEPFYTWMKVGFEAYGAASACGFPRYARGPVRGTAVEVFPHATVTVLKGCLPPARASKRAWRSAELSARGVGAEALTSVDQIDAGLAALTGLLALQGEFCGVGDPVEGVIVLPAGPSQIQHPYTRCPGEPTGDDEPSPDDDRRRSLLWTRVRIGRQAERELSSRGWELPPEMR